MRPLLLALSSFALVVGGVAVAQAEGGPVEEVVDAGLLLPGKAAGDREEPGASELLTVEQMVEALASAEATAAERRDAASRLFTLADGGVEAGFEAFKDLLLEDQPAEVKRELLEAVARCAYKPSNELLQNMLFGMRGAMALELERPWAQALGRYESPRIAEKLEAIAGDAEASMELRRQAILALGEHRSRFAAEDLVGLINGGLPEPYLGLAYQALSSLSHQPGIGRDARAWSGWYEAVQDLDEAKWQQHLHDNLLRQTRENQAMDALVRERLIQAQSALYRVTSEEQRPGLLVEMLGDPIDAVRELAMDIARKRAEDNREFGPALREQLRALLDDPRPRVREQSATLLGQLLDEPAADAMAQRLADLSENDAAVQQAMLIALTQMPREKALEPGLILLFSSGSLQPHAAGMLAAAQRAGLGEAGFWSLVRAGVREAFEGVEKPRPQMVTLLGLIIGEDDKQDWSRIGGWLGSEDDRVREAAARVWAGSSQSLAVLARRSDDAVIRPIALKAIAERGRRTETLAAVAERRPTEPDDIRLWEQALIAMAGRVSPDALLDTIHTLADNNGETRKVREHMLTAAIDRADKPDPPTRADLSLYIARAEVRVLADSAPLIALDYEAALKHADILADAQLEGARRGLTRAYLADRRVAEALAAATQVLRPDAKLIDNADADPLVEALVAAARLAVDQGRKEDAGKIVAGVRKILGPAIAPERDAVLSAIQAEAERDDPIEPEA